MKSIKFLVIALVAAISLIGAGVAMAQVAGGPHDMTTYLTGQTGGYAEVCVYCHTPHAASTDAQLWNRTQSLANGSYGVYTSVTLASTVDATLGAGSLLCMSCHDGTVAVDDLYNTPNFGAPATAGDGTVLGTATKALLDTRDSNFGGTRLANSHPVGFTYDDTLDSTGLRPIATVRASALVRLYDDATVGAATQVECGSCHDPHNYTDQPFLRASNAASQICTACHIK